MSHTNKRYRSEEISPPNDLFQFLSNFIFPSLIKRCFPNSSSRPVLCEIIIFCPNSFQVDHINVIISLGWTLWTQSSINPESILLRLMTLLILIIVIMTNPPHRPIICCHQYHFQSWLDIVRTINRDSALYGIGVAPLELDPLLPEPINIDQEMVGYQVTVSSFFLLTQCKKTKIKILSSGETKHVECHGSWHPGYRTWQVHIYDLIVCPFIFHIWFWWMY